MEMETRYKQFWSILTTSKGNPSHISNSLIPPTATPVLGNHPSTYCHHWFAYSGHFFTNPFKLDPNKGPPARSHCGLYRTWWTKFSSEAKERFLKIFLTCTHCYIYSLIYFVHFGLCWVFAAAGGLSLVAAHWPLIPGLLLVQSTGSKSTGSVVATCWL